MWISPCQHEICRHTKSPNICTLTQNILAGQFLKHFWCKELKSSNSLFAYVLALFQRTYSKIYQNCFIIMIDHNIFRFDIPMYNLYYLVAVIQRFQHIDEEQSAYRSFKSSAFADFAIMFALRVMIGVLTIYFIEKVDDATVCMIFCDKIQIIFQRGIDYLLQP